MDQGLISLTFDATSLLINITKGESHKIIYSNHTEDQVNFVWSPIVAPREKLLSYAYEDYSNHQKATCFFPVVAPKNMPFYVRSNRKLATGENVLKTEKYPARIKRTGSDQTAKVPKVLYEFIILNIIYDTEKSEKRNVDLFASSDE